jgi:hypothetical protein
MENADLAERDLFALAGEDDVLFVSPVPVSDEFFGYYTSLFGRKNIKVLTPRVHTGELCEDVLEDDSCMDAIVAAANGQRRLVMVPYATSAQFLKLVNVFRAKNIEVYTPESPEEEDAWTVDFFGSKSGIRQLSQQSRLKEPDFIMPEGLINMGVDNAVKIAAKKYLLENGVVIKTNRGHSGAGVLIFREGQLPTDYHECVAAITAALKKDKYWDKFPIVVENYITPNMSIGGGFPNAEFRIYKTGKIEFLYYCGMRVDRDGVFHGVEINDDVLSDKVRAQVMDTGFFVGEQYAAAGYRGYFEVDFIAAKNGELFVTESNIRRTGGTHVYRTAEALIGKEFFHDVYAISDNAFRLPKGGHYTFTKVMDALKPILFDKATKEGVIVPMARSLEHDLIAYIVLGNDKKRAADIEQRMFDILSQLHPQNR